MVDVEDLSFAYSGAAPLFSGFGFRVEKGVAWAIIGPSGCGKSTLLCLIAGLRRPAGGAIRVAGETILRPRPQTGLVLQDHGLLPWASVRENVGLGFKIRKFYGPDGRHAPAKGGVLPAEAQAHVDYWLKRLGISELAGQYPAQLSRGQRQRTALARTLALKPDLLLMDEPFSALDASIREDLQKLMFAFRAESDLTSITVTHDIEEALFMGEKILVLRGKENRDAQTLENPLAGKPDFRRRPAFQDLYRQLRAWLERDA